jgi:DNA-binding Xre family transcriptional regulator
MASFKPSEYGMQQIKQAIKNMGWSTTDPRWLILVSKHLDSDSSKNWDDYLNWKPEDLEAEISYLVTQGISLTTWKRFIKGSQIRSSTFEACCKALGLNWQEIVDQHLFDYNQKVVGVQARYTDPEDYVGTIWTQIVPEPQNVGKRHAIAINWGSWCWRQVKAIPAGGLLLIYRKRLRDCSPRIVTVSTFSDKSSNRVTSITDSTKVINSHIPIEHRGQCVEINRGWEETWEEPPLIEQQPNNPVGADS